MPRDIVREGISMMNNSRRRGTAVHRLMLFLLPVLGGCAGVPHPENESRYMADSFGFAHAGIRGEADRELLALMGADMVRQDISWSEAQGRPGPFDFTFFDARMDAADAAGVSMVGLLVYDTPWIHDNPEGLRQVDPEDIPAWVDYVEAAAERYADRVEAFEVWNEPNFDRFWTGSEEESSGLPKRGCPPADAIPTRRRPSARGF